MIFAAAFASLTLLQAANATPATCIGTGNTPVRGTVRDSTGALIPGAVLLLDGRQVLSGDDGSFTFPCAATGAHKLLARAPGFEDLSLKVSAPQHGSIQVTLLPAAVQTAVEVSADTPGVGTPRVTLSGDQLQTLADDPDDLLRELQQLGATSGGSPENTIITIDGFQGPSKLPPKSSIAYIEVEPDLYSAEYASPPYSGGRVNVFTKPGQKTFHGALFATNGSPWENARDPFSVSKAAIGKGRYGFELTGPVRKRGSDFSLNLEHRTIDDFAVVNAITLDPSGAQMSTVANVPTPQALWEGQARLDWQLGSKNTLATTFSSNVNDLQNEGVGGTMLAETGYSGHGYEHILRFSNLTTASPHFVHEARLSLRWDGEDDTPVSDAPQINVAGSFTGGGATVGRQQLHEFNLEADDDAILTSKRHNLKVGTQLMLYRERQQLTSNFNGTYTFGGGVAPVLDSNNLPVPGATETISGLEQYRRALLGLAGGAPTAFSNVTGTPAVQFTQVQDALYIQDDINAGHNLHFEAGLRYAIQNSPTTLNAITPRVGLLWSPKGTHLTLHARAGLFATLFKETDQAEVLREDGVQRVTSTVYNPVYGNPFFGGTPIHSERRFSPHIANIGDFSPELGAGYDLRLGFHIEANYGAARIWNDLRSKNINAPLDGTPTGPRALGVPDLNLLEMQNSAQDRVGVQEIDLENTHFKHFHVDGGGVRVNITGDADNDHFFTPQSSFSNAGEFSPITNLPVWQIWGSLRAELPYKITFSTRMSGSGDQHYNLTTGFDNNGDGNFNDRPDYAAPGSPGAIATKYGLLTATGGNAVLRRNEGVLPWKYYVDSNLQKPFTLTHDPKAEHQQILTVNIRSANILNHTNVTQQGGVLGSPLFDVPYAADTGRRVEAGLRYSF